MPSPKSGTAGTVVPPAEPEKAIDADVADPVENYKSGGPGDSKNAAADKKRKSGQGSQNSSTGGGGGAGGGDGGAGGGGGGDENAGTDEEKKTSWVEIVMLDQKDNPVAGMKYEITLPDNTVRSGTLDEKGAAKVSGFEPGGCKVSFPSLDQEAWE